MTQEQITALQSELKSIDDKQAAIEQKLEKDHGGQWTDDLRAEYDSLTEKYDAKKAELETAQADYERSQLRKNRGEIVPTRPRHVAPGADMPLPGNNSDPSQAVPFKLPAEVRRHRVKSFLNETVDGRGPEERAYRFGQWILSTASHCLPARFRFESAMEFSRQQFAAAHDSSDGSSHYYVPDEFSADMINLKEMYGVARRLFRMWPTPSGDTLMIPRRASGFTGYWVGESNQITESNTTADQVQLILKKLAVIGRMSSELAADSIISIADFLIEEIAQVFANKEDDAAFNGDGTSTYGGVDGARNALKVAAGSPTTTSAGGIVVGAGNAYSELTLANFHSVVGALPLFARNDATWVVSNLFYETVMASLQTAAGGNAVTDIANGGQPRFLGFPVALSQVMPTAAANSQVCALLGNWNMGAAMIEKGGSSIMFSEHATVNSTSVFEYDQIAIRGIERVDFAVHGVGNATTASAIVGLQTLNS